MKKGILIIAVLSFFVLGCAARQIAPGMVRIEGGSFTMGSSVNEIGHHDRESPQHQVTVVSFYIGKYEVTQKEYQELMGTNPSNFMGENLPVEKVSWYDAIEYCNALSRKEGLSPAYTIEKGLRDLGNQSKDDSLKWVVTWNRDADGYRLPTEAEWEYACRAGTISDFNTGDRISGDTGWYKANSGKKTHPVGQKPANAWGLHDMHGNVAEWCWNWYEDYSGEVQADPEGAPFGAYRVIRGGSWDVSAQFTRSAFRGGGHPGFRESDLGFRLARNEQQVFFL